MDTNQGSTETPKKPEEHHAHSEHNAGWISTPEEKKEEKKLMPDIKMPIDVSKFKISSLKMPIGGFGAWIKGKFSEYKRVYSITKKPDKTEFTAIVKASGLGIIVIGVVGFIITMIVQVIQMAR